MALPQLPLNLEHEIAYSLALPRFPLNFEHEIAYKLGKDLLLCREIVLPFTAESYVHHSLG